MRVVFMGTPDFAVPSLDALIAQHDVVAVYTRPDAATGRGRRLVPSPVKARAEVAGIPVEQPSTLRGQAAAEALASYRPDVVVVAAFGMLLPASILSVPPLGCVNVHGSVLPRWRGAAPIQRAILAGDDATGVSIMRMEEGLDTGPVCLVRTTDVDDKGAAELTAELAALGAEALLEALPRIQDGSVLWAAQDEGAATYAAKLSAEDVALAPGLTVDEALRRVRASGPSAPCRIVVDGKLLVVLEASRSAADLPDGTATARKRLELGLADGAIVLDRVVPEGRATMTGAAYACGARIDATCEWGEA
jgi:methionyl-tRNA formyltransferase